MQKRHRGTSASSSSTTSSRRRYSETSASRSRGAQGALGSRHCRVDTGVNRRVESSQASMPRAPSFGGARGNGTSRYPSPNPPLREGGRYRDVDATTEYKARSSDAQAPPRTAIGEERRRSRGRKSRSSSSSRGRSPSPASDAFHFKTWLSSASAKERKEMLAELRGKKGKVH